MRMGKMGLTSRPCQTIFILFSSFMILEFLYYRDYRFLYKVQQIIPTNAKISKRQFIQQDKVQQVIPTNVMVSQRQLIQQEQDKDEDLVMHNITEFFHYVETPTRTCKNSKVFGGIHGTWSKTPFFDGDKVVCLDKDFDINPKNCLVYSFGINNEWSFDKAMARFGCKIYAFDPTMNVKTHKISDKIMFYNIGIGNKDGHVMIGKKLAEVKHFSSIMALLGHLKDDVMIDYLKMDVEGAEVQFLEDVLQNAPHLLQRIKQIGMEIHVKKYNQSRIKIFQKNYGLFKQLERLGFRLFSSKKNPLPYTKYFLSDVGRTVNGYYELVWGLWPGSH